MFISKEWKYVCVMLCYWTLHYFMQRKGNCVFWIPNMSVWKIHKCGLEGLWPNASVFRWHNSKSLKACRCCVVGCCFLIYSSGEKHVIWSDFRHMSSSGEINSMLNVFHVFPAQTVCWSKVQRQWML